MSAEKRRAAMRLQGKYGSGKSSAGEKAFNKRKSADQEQNQNQPIVNYDVIKTSSHTQDYIEMIQNRKKPIELEMSEKWCPIDLQGSKIFYSKKFLDSSEARKYYNRLLATIDWKQRQVVVAGKTVNQPRKVAWFGPHPYAYSGMKLEENEEWDKTVLEIKEKVELFLKEHVNKDIFLDNDITLNSVLLNLYKDQYQSVGWHSDDEISLGVHPTIVSISLGENRRFEMKRKKSPFNKWRSGKRPSTHFNDRNTPRKKPRLEGDLNKHTEHVTGQDDIMILSQLQSSSSQEIDEDVDLHVDLENGSLFIMDGPMQKHWLHRLPKCHSQKKPRINLTFRCIYELESSP